MKEFYLQRNEDESGVSGTGKVAEGVVFDNGLVVLSWNTVAPSVGVYQSIEDIVKIHGHNGKTLVTFQEEYKDDHRKGNM